MYAFKICISPRYLGNFLRLVDRLFHSYEICLVKHLLRSLLDSLLVFEVENQAANALPSNGLFRLDLGVTERTFYLLFCPCFLQLNINQILINGCALFLKTIHIIIKSVLFVQKSLEQLLPSKIFKVPFIMPLKSYLKCWLNTCFSLMEVILMLSG